MANQSVNTSVNESVSCLLHN